MKKGLLLSALLLGSLAAQAADVVFDGQIRYRMENVGHFDGDVDSYNMSLLRTRLGATVQPQDGLKIYIQAQDSRVVGGSDHMAGTTMEDSKLGLHQGFFTWNCKLVDGLTIQAGRFEWAKADHRFFGNVGWNNVGRSFEGWTLNYSGLGFASFDLYGLKMDENYTANEDRTAWGLYLNKIMGYNLDVFYNVDDFGQQTVGTTEVANTRSTIGAHYDNTYFDALGVNVNFGMQMGTREKGWFDASDGSSYATDVDYAGMMYGVDLSWTLGLGYLEKVGFGYESMSGQDTSSDNTAWHELYPTGHKFHGYMDVVGQTAAGLNDIQLNVWGALPLGLQYKLDYHLFSSVEDYTNTTEAADTAIGSEIDLTLKKSMGDFGVNLGYSMFMPEDNFVMVGGDSADAMSWMYLQFTAGF